MDPEACLAQAEARLKLSSENRMDVADAVEDLINYIAWRKKGGFEPTNGDDRARVVLVTIITRLCTWTLVGLGRR